MRWLLPLMLLGALACSSGSTGSVTTPKSAGHLQSAATTEHPAASPTPSGLGGGTTEASTPSSSPSPSTGPKTKLSYAVLVDLFAGGNSYNVALVGADGGVAARAHAAERSPISDAIELPYAMASRSRVYYLDGDRRVRFIKADGTTGIAATVPGNAQVHA